MSALDRRRHWKKQRIERTQKEGLFIIYAIHKTLTIVSGVQGKEKRGKKAHPELGTITGHTQKRDC
jgi:hypothetical protein